MYSAYKLNKLGDDIQPWRTPFPIWNQSVFPCPVRLETELGKMKKLQNIFQREEQDKTSGGGGEQGKELKEEEIKFIR